MKLLKSLQFKSRKNSGFTLIELLIVIAVLGVLAAAVITALNPLEQLARGRDSARVSNIAELGKSYSSYLIAAGLTAYPQTFATGDFEDLLVTAKELGGKISVSSNGSNACSGGASLYTSGGTVCYQVYTVNSVAGADMAIWTTAESSNIKTKAGCTSSQVAVIAWVASQGKVGLQCVATLATPPNNLTPLL